MTTTVPAGPVTASGHWLETPTAPPRIGLSATRIEEITCQELRELPFPPYPIALQPFLLSRQAYRELLDAAAELLGLIRRSVTHSGADSSARLGALRLNATDCPYWTDDEEWELRHCADLARADVVLGADGPKFVEFNVSGAFGGMLHFQLYQRAWQRVREEAGEPAFIGVDAYARLARLVERTCAELGAGAPSVVLVGTPREWGPNTPRRHFLQQADLLRQHGIEAVHLDFEDLVNGIGTPGRLRYPLGIAQFDVHDAEQLGYDVSPVRTAQANGFRLIPSATSWMLHTKRQLALLSEGQPWMSVRDHELAARYLPWSRVVGDRSVRWRDDEHDMRTLLLDHRDRFVLKGSTGFSGAEVFFGGRSTPQDWTALVERALSSDYYIAQEVVEAVPLPVDVAVEPGVVTRVVANPVISPFVVAGAGAGCFARFIADHQPGVISALSQAKLTCLLAEA